MNGSTNRRLSALEQIAETTRRNEIREQVMTVAQAEGWGRLTRDVEQATIVVHHGDRRIAALREQGLLPAEILQRYAEELGTTVEELEAECAHIIGLLEGHRP